MGLTQLLAVGRTLICGEDRENRYRLPRSQWLPTFGPRRNPFTAQSPEPAEPSAAATAPPPPVIEPLAPAPVPAAPERAESAERRLRPAAGWLARLNPRVLARNGLAPLRGRTPKHGGGEQQAELSLDNVQVVRNDLSDDESEAAAEAPSLRHLTGLPPGAHRAAPERDVEEMTVNRLKQSFRPAEQVALF